MEYFRIAILISGCISILFGYLRFITDEKGHVDLNNYRFTGGLGLVIIGLFEGARDIFSRNISAKSCSALAIFVGVLLLYLGFRL